MVDNEEPMRFDELSVKSTQELIIELAKRASSSSRHAMILVMGRPQEGDPEMSEGHITVAGHSPALISYLLAMLMERFQATVSEDGYVFIPSFNLKGDSVDILEDHDDDEDEDERIRIASYGERVINMLRACEDIPIEALEEGVIDELLKVVDVLVGAYDIVDKEGGSVDWRDIDDAYHLAIRVKSLINRHRQGGADV